MKFSTVIVSSFLAAYTSASPIVATGTSYNVPEGVSIQEMVARGEDTLVKRQSNESDVSANEFLDTGCKDVVMVYARGSTQDGNLVRSPSSRTVYKSATNTSARATNQAPNWPRRFRPPWAQTASRCRASSTQQAWRRT